jgi:DnaJ-class molecular chaperone
MFYKMEQCTNCNGSGLVLREEPFLCPGFHSSTIVSCVYCENVNKGVYVSCEKCYGCGKAKVNPPKLNTMSR